MKPPPLRPPRARCAALERLLPLGHPELIAGVIGELRRVDMTVEGASLHRRHELRQRRLAGLKPRRHVLAGLVVLASYRVDGLLDLALLGVR
jgi:hypothetical protein